MRAIIRITALLLVGACFCAQAGQPPKNAAHRYRWVDASGLPHYSDSLSMEALKFGYDVIGPGGMVVRHIPAELTASERKAARAKAAREAALHRQTVQREQKDRQMLMAYPTEAAFKAAQQARLDSLDEGIRTTRINLRSQEQNLAQLLGHAADYSREGKPVPASLSKRITDQRLTVADQRESLKARQTHRAEAEQQAAKELAHYRQLREARKARYGGP